MYTLQSTLNTTRGMDHWNNSQQLIEKSTQVTEKHTYYILNITHIIKYFNYIIRPEVYYQSHK